MAGCAARLPDDHSAAIPPEQLLAATPLAAPARSAPAPVDVLALDADMRGFVAARVNARLPPERRLEQLLAAVIGDERFGVVYNDRTYTAVEAFRLREANCLSFTNMFIALAREAGLDVSFQEVDVPPDWTLSGDVLVLNRHVNVLVHSKTGADRVVDFNMADFHTAYDRRAISDGRGRAHYYSNLGAERLQAGDDAAALDYFRLAIGEDPGFAPAWVNLGTLYLRRGYRDEARASWRHALEVSPSELVAVSNLERLYRLEGRTAEADELRRRIQRHRDQNPYYRFYLAQQAFDAGRYEVAVGHLKFAVRKKKSEDRFLELLGLSYLRLGDAESARRYLAQAEAIADDSGRRARYHGKLEMLRRIGTG